jgi:hypothetical protein
MVCPNCKYVETTDAAFCSSCGQKFGPGKLTIKEYIRDLLDHVFALETTFLRTLRRIFIPGQLTIDYFNGFRRRYYHPLRLFFVLLVLHLGIVGSLIPYNDIFREVNETTNAILNKHNMNRTLDTLSLTHKDQASSRAMDSVATWFDIDRSPTGKPDSSQKSQISFLKFTGISPEDVILLSNDSLAAKYNVKDYWTRLLLRQSQKFSLDPKGMIQYVLGNVSWMMIILIPLLAFFMKVLFLRRNRYYIEHLFFLYHWHAFAFLVVSLLVLLFRNYLTEAWWPVMLVVIFYGIVAWVRYYHQGIIKSLLKFFTMGIMYIFLFAVLLVITASISFGIY